MAQPNNSPTLYSRILDTWHEEPFSSAHNDGQKFIIRFSKNNLRNLGELLPDLRHLKLDTTQGAKSYHGKTFFENGSDDKLTIYVDELGDDLSILSDFVIEEYPTERILFLTACSKSPVTTKLKTLTESLKATLDENQTYTWKFTSKVSFCHLWNKVKTALGKEHLYTLVEKRVNENRSLPAKSFLWCRSDNSFARELGTHAAGKTQVASDFDYIQGTIESTISLQINGK